MAIGDWINGAVGTLVSSPLSDGIDVVGKLVSGESLSPGDYLRIAGDAANIINPAVGKGLHVVGNIVDTSQQDNPTIGDYVMSAASEFIPGGIVKKSAIKAAYSINNDNDGGNEDMMNQMVPAYNPVAYNGLSQAPDAMATGAYVQQQAQNQAGWQQGQQLAYNNALNNQAQLANQQFAQTANAAANANQQRALVGAAASALNGIYQNSMAQMNGAAQTTQNTLQSLANTASGMFR
jgi:hypothetical protein